MTEKPYADVPATPEHLPLDEAEREAVERELEAFSDAVAGKLRLADERYRQAMEAVHAAEGEKLDPMADPAVREAYLELQALHGELEAAAEEARRVAASVRPQAE